MVYEHNGGLARYGKLRHCLTSYSMIISSDANGSSQRSLMAVKAKATGDATKFSLAALGCQLVDVMSPDMLYADENSKPRTESTCCAVCGSADLSSLVRCLGCDAMEYCSRKCQIEDLHSHRLLCESFASFAERPGDRSRRAIFFPEEAAAPKWCWVRFKTPKLENVAFADVYELLRHVAATKTFTELDGMPIQYNAVLGHDTGKTIYTWYRNEMQLDGSRALLIISAVISGRDLFYLQQGMVATWICATSSTS